MSSIYCGWQNSQKRLKSLFIWSFSSCRFLYTHVPVWLYTLGDNVFSLIFLWGAENKMCYFLVRSLQTTNKYCRLAVKVKRSINLSQILSDAALTKPSEDSLTTSQSAGTEGGLEELSHLRRTLFCLQEEADEWHGFRLKGRGFQPGGKLQRDLAGTWLESGRRSGDAASICCRGLLVSAR